MNIRKNAEFIFVAVTLLAMVTTFAAAKTPGAPAAHPAKMAASASDGKAAVATIKHRRPSFAEKAAL